MEKYIRKNFAFLFLIIFILIASFIRFYQIFNLNFFTYDQARDALFVKRMIVDHQWRLLGTQTSLPGMYLPPFYYYTVAIVLWLFKLNPVGIDIYSALIGVLSVPLVYFVANKIFGKPAGIFSAGLFAVSPLVVELTRRAWNPNTLPFFILLTFYFVYMYFREEKTKYFLLAFGFYGYCLSLHFGAWTLMPLFILIWFIALKKRRLGKLGLLGSIGILFFFISPILLFEIRHHFFLFQQAAAFFLGDNHLGLKPGVNFFESFLVSLISLFTVIISGKISVGYGAPFELPGKLLDIFNLNTPISVVAQKPFSISFQWWGTLILVLIIFLTFKKFKENRLALTLIWVWTLWGILISKLYSGSFYFFYYLYLFPVPILLFGWLFKNIATNQKLIVRVLGLTFFVYIIVFHLVHTSIFESNWRNIEILRETSRIISQNINQNESFNIATIQKNPDQWDRNSVDYRYFVETFENKRALDWFPENYENVQKLFVIDESGNSDVLNSSIMEIRLFNPKKIVNKTSLSNGLVIYSLGK